MDHHTELEAILEQVETAGLVEQFIDDDGRPALRLTPEGVRVARQMAMSDDPDGLLDALLEARESQEEARPLAGRASMTDC